MLQLLFRQRGAAGDDVLLCGPARCDRLREIVIVEGPLAVLQAAVHLQLLLAVAQRQVLQDIRRPVFRPRLQPDGKAQQHLLHARLRHMLCARSFGVRFVAVVFVVLLVAVHLLPAEPREGRTLGEPDGLPLRQLRKVAVQTQFPRVHALRIEDAGGLVCHIIIKGQRDPVLLDHRAAHAALQRFS